MLRPADRSGPRDPYFLRMQEALRKEGVAAPTLVIDKARLAANVDTMLGHLPDGMGYRVVAKSLPALELLETVRARARTDRVMTFNLPMLSALSAAMPDAAQLLGKPLPVAAAARFFADSKAPVAASRVAWLVDSAARLTQYEALARGLGVELRVAFELDVGLHRGGFTSPEALAEALRLLEASPRLRFAGLMGYEPHLASVPTTLGLRRRALGAVQDAYQGALAVAREVLGADVVARSVRNTAGSPTYRLYDSTEIANEVSVGSVLVKPTDFDTDLLTEHVPACFIATPVLKTSARTRMPSLLAHLDGIRHAWDPNYRQTIFVYGGHWLADPEDPPGLAYNRVFGRSSNQEMLTVGPRCAVAVDDFVFFRPHQSEAVLQRFGDIAVYEDGEIRGWWAPFSAAG